MTRRGLTLAKRIAVRSAIAVSVAVAMVLGAALPAHAYSFILLLNADVPLNAWQHVPTSLSYTAIKVVTGSPGYQAVARVSGVGTSSGSGSVITTFTLRRIDYECQAAYLSVGSVRIYCYAGTGS